MMEGQINGGSNDGGSNGRKLKCMEGQMIEDEVKRIK